MEEGEIIDTTPLKKLDDLLGLPFLDKIEADEQKAQDFAKQMCVCWNVF